MAAPVRFAVIGLDHWYSAIPVVRALVNRPDTELVAIADANIDRAKEVAAQVGLDRVSDNGPELIEDSQVQAIASFVSVDANPAICIAAAKAGKHIMSIKPLARTLPEADQIVAAVRAAGVVFVPAESRMRESTQNKQLYEWVRSGTIGRIVNATFSLNGGLPHGWPGDDDPGWWVDPERAPGGAWIDHSIYQIDLMRWLLGEEVKAISGRAGNLLHQDLGVEDYGHAIVEFTGGAIATVEDTWTSPAGGHRVTTSLVGTKGSVAVDSLTGNISLMGQDGPLPGWVHGRAPVRDFDGLDGMLGAIAGTAEPIATVEDAWENLSACVAFYQAAASGQVVEPAHLQR
jgi:predicted dehydrogenase